MKIISIRMSQWMLALLICALIAPFSSGLTSSSAAAASSDASPIDEPVVNLAAGKTPTLTLVSGNAAQTAVEAPKVERLTDNVYGGGNWSADRSKYADFFRQIGRSLVIDLGQPSTVRKISLSTLFDASAAIGLPDQVNFSLSNDGGTTWRYIGSVSKDEAIPINEKKSAYQLNGLHYQADMVRVSFDVNIWVFADELSVFGQASITSDAVQAPNLDFDDPFQETNAFPAPGSEQTGGTRNDLLVYGGWREGTKIETTVDFMRPAVAYLDPQGNIKDMMFDSFTYLPLGTASSGRDYAAADKKEKAGNKVDWQEYLDYLYEDSHQLDALNEAVGEAKAALSKSNYQAIVRIAIPRPIPAQTDFGTVNGKALNFNPDVVGDTEALANRTAAVNWYVDEFLNRWNPARYPNLKLEGFYWYNEEVLVMSSNGEEKLLQQINNHIHQLGFSNYWIPFYQAGGFYKWKSLGFDYAIMQPNYSFSNTPDNQPTIAANLSKRFGLGVEMELHWDGLDVETLRQKYLRYLDQGVTAGYMNGSVRAWFVGTQLRIASASKIPSQREIYDKTYASIKGAYPNLPDTQSPIIPQPDKLNFFQSEAIHVEVPVSDTGSGVKEVVVTLDGAPISWSQSFAPATISAGKHVLHVRASDHAGNVSEATFHLIVTIDVEHLDDVIQAGADSNRITNPGIANSLLVKVGQIQQTNDKKLQKLLSSMMDFVQKHAGKQIETNFANLLTQDIEILLHNSEA